MLLGTVTTAASAVFAGMKRDAMVKSATQTEVMNATGAALFTDDTQTAGARTVANIDWTQDLYIIFAVSCATGTDSALISGYTIEIL